MLPEKVQFVGRLPLKGPGKLDRDLLKMQAQIGPLMETVPFFAAASDEFIRDVVPGLECLEFDKGEVVFRRGDVGEAMFFLTRGRVEVVAKDGQTQLATLNEGSYFGELAILKEIRRTATFRVLEACELYELKRDCVLELTKTYPEFGQHLGEALEAYRETELGED